VGCHIWQTVNDYKSHGDKAPASTSNKMDDSFNYDMGDNLSDRGSNEFDDSQEYEDHQQTQSTQQASQQPPVESNDTHLWGYLQPCTGGLTRIDFWKIHPRYTIGRNTEYNQVVFPGFKISGLPFFLTNF
jgi:serine/threonine/tyrosine protein kinase RAD53